MVGRARGRTGLAIGIAAVVAIKFGARATASPGPLVAGDVALLSAGAGDAVIDEASARLRLELGAIGYESHDVTCGDVVAFDVRACRRRGQPRVSAGPVAASASAPAPGATTTSPPLANVPVGPPGAPLTTTVPGTIISFARESGVVTIEVVESLADGSRVFRLVFVPTRDGGRDPSVLAVRAVELLHDLQLEVERGARTPRIAPVASAATVELPPPPPPETVVRSPDADERAERVAAAAASAAEDEDEARPWHVTVSWAGLRGRQGLASGAPAGLGVALGASRELRGPFALFVVASGPFYQDFEVAYLGAATSRQELAFAGVRAERRFWRVHAFASAGAGVLHVTAWGTRSDFVGGGPISSSAWAASLTAGGGLAVPVFRGVEVLAQLDTVWSAPSPVIEIVSESVGRAGAPSLLMQLGARLALP